MINNLPKSLVEAARKVLLAETFDNPKQTVDVPEDSPLHMMGAFSAAMIGGDNFKMSKIDGPGYLIQFDKDGATELHHVNDDLQGGFKGHSSREAFGMLSTFANKAKNIIDSGKPVRIVAHKNLSDNFRKITDKLLSRNPGYTASESSESTHPVTGDPVVAWTIRKGDGKNE